MEAKSDTDHEKEALDRWIEAFRGPLIGLLASWGKDWRAAEELAQDTFAEAWVGRKRFVGSFKDHDVVGAWLRGIAFNLHNAARRKAERAGVLPLDDRDQAAEEVERDPRQLQLASAFEKLSAPHQTVLRMHYLEQTSAKDVAALLGLTRKAVEGRLYQARKSLRAELDRMNASQTLEVR